MAFLVKKPIFPHPQRRLRLTATLPSKPGTGTWHLLTSTARGIGP
jgi:hypothetical protein